MATGASNAQLAIILIYARNGVLVQIKRHSFICSLRRNPRCAGRLKKIEFAWAWTPAAEFRSERLG
ncbi:hypothetical protein [Bradyrhizobium sp. ARR65]|uniref:hypothetical protein n=1 Tax=Bradyrhizobium sp. ARR65 TaxID=1040989 RepID=UPI0032DF46FD